MKKIVQAMVFVSACLINAGCDSDSAPKKKESETLDTATDMPTDKFEYIEATEFDLDTDAFLNAHTKENYQVGTLYFEGGTGKNCAKWDITITGEDISLARGETLKAEDQTRLTEDLTAGVLTGAIETRGAVPGIRLVVKRNTIVTFSGVQSYCKTTDKAEFSVQENIDKSKLHEIFRGVEINGIGFMTLKFSDEKNAETIEKAKKAVADAAAEKAAAAAAAPAP